PWAWPARRRGCRAASILRFSCCLYFQPRRAAGPHLPRPLSPRGRGEKGKEAVVAAGLRARRLLMRGTENGGHVGPPLRPPGISLRGMAPEGLRHRPLSGLTVSLRLEGRLGDLHQADLAVEDPRRGGEDQPRRRQRGVRELDAIAG